MNDSDQTDNRGSGSGIHFDTGHLEADLKSRSIRGGAVTVSGQIGRFVIQTGSTIVLARLLTPSAFGLVAMVTAVIGFARLFKDLGLSMATIQKPAVTHEQISALFWINAAVSVAIALATVALAPVIAWFYGEPRLLPITTVLAVSFLLGGLTVQHQALLRRQMRYVSLATVDILSMLAGVIAAIVAARFGAGYWALIIKQLVMDIGIVSGTWLVCSWRPGLRLRGTGIREMLHFGADLTGFNILNYFARNLDHLLIGRVWGAAQLGFYSKAYSLLMLPLNQVNAPISAVAVPALSRLQNDPDRYRSYYLKTIKLIAFLTMPGVLFLVVLSDEVVLLLLGPQWVDAGRIFGVLGLAGLIQPVANSTGWLFISQGRTRDMFRWGIIGSARTVLSILAGLPWGAFGVALSYTTVSLATDPLLYWYVGRTGPVGMRDIYGALLTPASISLVVLVCLLALKTLAADAAPSELVGLAALVTAPAIGLCLLILPGGRGIRGDVADVIGTVVGGRAARSRRSA